MRTNPTRRILVVDDEPSICNALRRALKRESYEVLVAHDPAEALAILKSHPVDLVLSDHMMPTMSGVEFLAIVRDRHPDCLRILLTGQADTHTAISAINDGAVYKFLTKPWDDVELKVTLTVAFQQLDLDREHRRVLATVRSKEDRFAVQC